MAIVADENLETNLGRHSRARAVFIKQGTDFVRRRGKHNRLSGGQRLQRNKVSQSTKIPKGNSDVFRFAFCAQRAISEPVAGVTNVKNGPFVSLVISRSADQSF